MITFHGPASIGYRVHINLGAVVQLETIEDGVVYVKYVMPVLEANLRPL